MSSFDNEGFDAGNEVRLRQGWNFNSRSLDSDFEKPK